MKKIMTVVLVIAVLCGVGYGVFYYTQRNQPEKKNNNKPGKNQNVTTSPIEPTPATAMTPVPSDGFSFAIQADSHLDQNTDTKLYEATLTNIKNNQPAFLIDLGDTFMAEKFGKTADSVKERYTTAKSYLDQLGDLPLYLVNGNHEGENGWSATEFYDLVLNARQQYFPFPADTENFSGNITSANYYSFTYQNVQCFVLDPFTYSVDKPKDDTEGWNYTLGEAQYQWFKTTLSQSTAEFKLVFIHNLVGGYTKDARGGVEAAKYFEWGGMDSDGTNSFTTKRPNFESTIHQLLVDNHVDIVFRGHDHFYAKQTLDGVIYQLVPQPGTPGNSVGDAGRYSYETGVFLPSAGYIRVVATSKQLTVEYIKTGADNIPDQYVISH